MTQPIAFLGTGLMGAPMVRNLLKAGHAVTVWNRTRDKAEALVADGAGLAETPAEAVRGAAIVITIVSDGPSVENLLFAQGVADALGAFPGEVETGSRSGKAAKQRSGALVIDMSSVTPSEARDHATRLETRDIAHLDAPVSGGTRGAAAATLAIMVGGSEDAFARAAPVLRALGRPVHVGPSGTGQLAKLANQAIVGVTIGVVAEATLLVAAGGGDVGRFRDALTGGFADSAILQVHGKRMTDGDFTPGGKSSTQLKDMNNIVTEAEKLGLELPLSEQVRARYRTLVDAMDGADLDHAALYLELKERARRG